MLEGIGGPELLFIGVLALLMFGSKRLPDLGRSLGRAMREFKKATSGVEQNLREVLREEPTPTIRPPVKAIRAKPPKKEPATKPETDGLQDAAKDQMSAGPELEKATETVETPTPSPAAQAARAGGEDDGPTTAD